MGHFTGFLGRRIYPQSYYTRPRQMVEHYPAGWLLAHHAGGSGGAQSEASWVALMVLYTACLRYGAPEHLISDTGGAFTSNDFERGL